MQATLPAWAGRNMDHQEMREAYCGLHSLGACPFGRSVVWATHWSVACMEWLMGGFLRVKACFLVHPMHPKLALVWLVRQFVLVGL